MISTAAAGGGEFIFISAVAVLLGGRAVAPVVTLGNMFAVPSRVAIFWKDIDWKIVRWFLGGAVPGGLIGAWMFAHTKAQWLQIIVALFLLSAPLQYRFGERERSFEARAWWFLPAGLIVAFLSGLIGGMGPVLNPLYLNYGTAKEEMVGTKSLNSSVMHIAKVGTYATLGAIPARVFALRSRGGRAGDSRQLDRGALAEAALGEGLPRAGHLADGRERRVSPLGTASDARGALPVATRHRAPSPWSRCACGARRPCCSDQTTAAINRAAQGRSSNRNPSSA